MGKGSTSPAVKRLALQYQSRGSQHISVKKKAKEAVDDLLARHGYERDVEGKEGSPNQFYIIYNQ